MPALHTPAAPRSAPAAPVVLTALLLLLSLSLRMVYVVAQPAHDPSSLEPIMDGRYYVDLAQGLSRGEGWPPGPFYRAPLYPLLLAGLFLVPGFGLPWLYVLQQLVAVAVAGLLARIAMGCGNPWAAPATALLALAYHPWLFFPARPLGEVWALLLLVLAVSWAHGRGQGAPAGAGLACGLGALARPNLLLLPLVWAVGFAYRRRWLQAGTVLVTAAVVLLPSTLFNYSRSGHLVPISANAGLTLYHGNGPGARGVYTQPAELSGQVDQQRVEATRVASLATGRPLDDVEADRWWGRQALAARLDQPGASVALIGRRASLLLASAEIGLDYAPRLDLNPWRHVAPLPFAVLLGLAAAGAYMRGWRASGGWPLWSALAAAALTPLVFYASSRYRLPVGVLLTIPAGVGLASLAGASRLRSRAVAVLVTCMLVSLMIPTRDLTAPTDAVSLAMRASRWRETGRVDRAEQDLGRALELAPQSMPAWFHLGLLREQGGDRSAALEAYRRALEIEPGQSVVATNLSQLLIAEGRAAEAIEPLRRVLERQPHAADCWTNLVIALELSGDRDGARDALARAATLGVLLDPELIEALAEPEGDP